MKTEPPAKEQKGGVQIEALARLPERTILDEVQLAKILCVASRTIRRKVSRFELPPPVPFGGRSVWLAGRILAHIESAAERAERDAKRAERQVSSLTP